MSGISTSRPIEFSLEWRHNGLDSVSNYQPRDCLLNRLFRRRSMKTTKPRFSGMCAGNSPGTGEFPAQMASNAENVSIWWRHHVKTPFYQCKDSHYNAWDRRETIRIHYTLMWQINTCDEWGINDSRRGSAESGIVLYPMSRGYRSTTIKVLWILCLVHQ